MKIYGSNVRDTLIGTKRGDTIDALGGNDLIATSGGIDTILAGSGNDMITGFSYKLSNSGDDGGGTGGGIGGGVHDSRAAAGQSISVDGGDGDHDIMLIELTAARGTSEVDSFKTAIKVKNIEEFIYNFASVNADQKILGDNNIRGFETIVIGAGDANVDARSGNDFIYTAGGNDIVMGGKGSDFIHAGEGHNIVSGGTSTDYFHFHLTGGEQYTEITDFRGGTDKVLITIDVEQYNLLFGTAYESPFPDRSYGDRYLGVGNDLNAYVSYNNGRAFDPEPDAFSSDIPTLFFENWASYEEETGSIFIRYYQEDPYDEKYVLVGHVTPGTEIDEADFSFRII